MKLQEVFPETKTTAQGGTNNEKMHRKCKEHGSVDP